MKSKLFAIAAAAALTIAALGCLKRTNQFANDQKKLEQFEKHGPMELYGAVCDYEELDLAYAPGEPDEDYLTLDVYWSEHEGRAPIIVNIHGGGWTIGDKRDINSVYRSRFLAGRGYVVVNANYRLLPKHPIPVQVNDVMGVVVWAKKNAEKYGGDPDRVGVMGGSAGGHLAAMAAWAGGDQRFSPTGHAGSNFDSTVQAAVPFYGVFDLEPVITLYRSWTQAVSHPFFTGVSDREEQKKILEMVSPKNYITPDLPPTLFVCGDQDEFKLYPQSVQYSRELAELGVPTGLVTVPGAGHGFDADYGEPTTREALEQVAAWFDAHLKHAAPPPPEPPAWSPVSRDPLNDDYAPDFDFEFDED